LRSRAAYPAGADQREGKPLSRTPSSENTSSDVQSQTPSATDGQTPGKTAKKPSAGKGQTPGKTARKPSAGKRQTPAKTVRKPSAGEGQTQESPIAQPRRERRMTVPTQKRLGQVLLEMEKVTTEQLQEAVTLKQEKGGALGAVLVDLGFCEQADVSAALAIQAGMRKVDLDEIEIPPEIVEKMDALTARSYSVVPIEF